jgi:hypothetical protein
MPRHTSIKVSDFGQWVATKAHAYDRDAILVSHEQLADLYDDAFFEATEEENSFP